MIKYTGLTTGHAQEVNALFGQYPDYTWNEPQKVQLRVALYGRIGRAAGVTAGVCGEKCLKGRGILATFDIPLFFC